MKKQVKLKAKETAASNSDFYNLFRPIAPGIDAIGKVAQVISGVTEAITIWYITQSEMAGSSKVLSIIVSIVAMLLVVAVLEMGGRKFLQVLTRAIVWRRLKNSWYIALFAIVSVITIGMGMLSFKLSTNGIHYAFVSNVPVGETFDASLLKEEYRSSLSSLSTRFDQDLVLLKERQQELIASTNAQYDSRIQEAKIKMAQYDQRYRKGAKWAQSHSEKYRKKASQLESEKTAAVAKIQKEHSGKLDRWQERKNQAIDQEKATLTAAIQKGEHALTTRHQSRFKNAAFWGNLFSFFVGFSVLLAFICIISVEVFRRGSGIQVEYREEEQELSTIEMLWFGLQQRLQSFFRRRAERFAGIQQPVATRSIGFNYPAPTLSNEANKKLLQGQADERTGDFMP
ncbi:MAG: hypothetical protein AAF990_03860 [Bacteroidota bacterium]